VDLHWIVLCYLVVVRRMGGIIVEGVCSVLLICIMTRGGRKEGRKEGRWGGGVYIFCVCGICRGISEEESCRL